MPTTQPGIECPADVNSSALLPFLKNEQPNTTTPRVKTRNTMKSITCIAFSYICSFPFWMGRALRASCIFWRSGASNL